MVMEPFKRKVEYLSVNLQMDNHVESVFRERKKDYLLENY